MQPGELALALTTNQPVENIPVSQALMEVEQPFAALGWRLGGGGIGR